MKVQDILDATYPRDQVILHYTVGTKSGDVEITPIGCDDYLKFGELDVMGIRAISDTIYVYAKALTMEARCNFKKF